MERGATRKGITLIELSVVIALIGLVFMISYPRLSGLIMGRKLMGFCAELAGTMDFVRARAVTDGKIYYVYLNRGKNLYWVMREGNKGEEPMEGRLGNGRRLPKDIYLKGVEVEQNPGTYFEPVIRFYPRGNSDEAVIRLETSRGDRASIWVKPYTGRSRVGTGFQKPS